MHIWFKGIVLLYGITAVLGMESIAEALLMFLNVVFRFLKRHLHGGPPDVVDTDALQRRVSELEEQVKKLENELGLAKQQVISTVWQLLNRFG